MPDQVTLSEAVEVYLGHRATKGIALTTLTNEGTAPALVDSAGWWFLGRVCGRGVDGLKLDGG